MNEDQLLEGVAHVEYEWTQMAGCAARLELARGVRSPEENATLEALLVHVRCLINFLCGNYKGEWSATDMKPADFIRSSWSLPDEEMDRRLRGRLPIINKSLAHLSWQRVTNKDGVLWPSGLVAHEVHWSMFQFVAEIGACNACSAPLWSVAAEKADRWMPPRRTDWMELRGFSLAPVRAAAVPGPIPLS